MLKKIFLALVALFFIFIGAIWLLFSYVKSNPDVVSSALERTIQHFTAGEPYEETHEELLKDIQHVQINTNQAPVEVHFSNDSSLKILYTGKVPKSESGPFIRGQTEGVKINLILREPLSSHFFQMNINGQDLTKASDSELIAKIFVPKTYKGTLRIESKTAAVTVLAPTNTPLQFDLQSVRGNVENQATPPTGIVDTNEIATIQVQTNSGNILVKSE